MNTKGGINLAYKVFKEDLKECAEYKRFKQDAVKLEYEDRLFRESQNPEEKGLIDPIYVLQPVEITVYYHVPDMENVETRKLNKKVLGY